MLPTTLQIATLAAPRALRLAQRGERVGRFSRLRDDDRQGVRRDDRVAVPVLGSVVDLDRHARELLDHELADQARVPRGAAGENGDPLDGGQPRVADADLLEEHAAGVLRDPAQDRLARGRRLLEDFLEHEVLVAGLLGHDRIPEHALRRLGDRAAEKIGELDAGARDDRHFLVAEEHDVARVAEDGRDVGRHEELAVAETDDERRAVADGDDLFRVVSRDQHEREQPAQQPERPPDRVLEAVVASSRARPGARRSRCRFR